MTTTNSLRAATYSRKHIALRLINLIIKQMKINLKFYIIFYFLIANTFIGFAQTGEKLIVTGKVSDASGPIPGASVIVKGTNTGTIAGNSGEYSIEVPYKDATLAFSFIGYQSQEVALAGRTVVNVTLLDDKQMLEETVVLAYGTQKRISVTGAISGISVKELKQSPVSNITTALAGRLPGLNIHQFGGGEVGVGRSNVYVRGFATTGDKSPIYIVDDIEKSIDHLAADEIESFTILKDASATAPYGVRGANGVILITTKRGTASEKATVNFKANIGVKDFERRPHYLGSADYARLYNQAIRNDNPGRQDSELNLFSDDAIDKFSRAKGDNSDGLGYNWDYFDYAMKPATQKNYALTIRGGSNVARYFVIVNYFDEDGNYKHQDLAAWNTQARFTRYNFRSNIDIDITKTLSVRLDVGGRINDRHAPATTAERIMELINTQPPNLPIVLEENSNEANLYNMSRNPRGMLYGDERYRFNLLGELTRTGYENFKDTYLEGTFVVAQKLDFITKGLKIEGTFSYDASEGRIIRRRLSTYDEGWRQYPGYATFQPSEGRDIYMEPGYYDGVYKGGNKYNIDQTITNDVEHSDAISRMFYQVKLNYSRSFNSHNISAMLLGNRSRRWVNQQIPFSYQGVTARATYNYDERYFIEANAAYNGSENFAKNKRYGLFPALSGSWVLSNESFMSGFDWINTLKFRASYGLVGSDKLPGDKRFYYLQYFRGGGGYTFGTEWNNGASGLREGDPSNPNLTWEKAKKMNLGIDLAFLTRKLSISFDYFVENRYDIFTELTGNDKQGFPDIVGTAAPMINSGKVKNKGFELEVSWNQRLGNFSYFIKPNISFARNTIQFMNEIPRDYEWRKQTGRHIDQYFVYQFDHFVKDEAEAQRLTDQNYQWGKLRPGDVVYKDVNGDGKITDLGDRVADGYPSTPEIMFGAPLGFTYKNFDFTIMFQGAMNGSILLTGPAVWDFPTFSQDKIGKVKSMHLNAWTPENADNATYPALSMGTNDNNKNPNNSLFLYDRKYLRLKSMEIGYNFPLKWIRKIGFQQARCYIQGFNILTFDKLGKIDIDPETGRSDGNWYPVPRTFSAGIDLTF